MTIWKDRTGVSKRMNEKLIWDRTELIKDITCKRLVVECFKKIPPYWFMKPASSTGKYHPLDEHLPGGLALHTARVFDIANILVDAQSPDVDQSVMLSGALLHDIARFGTAEKSTEHSVKDHATQGAMFVKGIGLEMTPPIPEELLDRISRIVMTHMGRWGSPKPDVHEERLVHFADVIAAGYTPVKGEKLV